MPNTAFNSHNKLPAVVHYGRYTTVAHHPFTMHERFELLYVRKGTLTLNIDKSTVTLHAGDLALIVPFAFHKNAPAGDFSVEFFSISPQLCPDAAYLFGANRPARPYLRSHEISPLLRELLVAIPEIITKKSAAANGDKYRLTLEESKPLQPYISVMLLEVTKKMTLLPVDTRNIPSMQKILHYCSTNFNQEITRDSVAEHCGVSLSSISQTFANLGISFRDYINTLRINRAYQLLTTTKKPITEIIYECGYSNQGTFNRNFQLQFGKSPRDLRQK